MTELRATYYNLKVQIGALLTLWRHIWGSPLVYLKQEVVCVVPVVDGGYGVQDGSAQPGAGALQEHGL